VFNANSNKRSHKVRKTGIKDENIDRQILVLHRAMVDKLLREKQLVPELLEKLEQRKAQGLLGYGSWLTWYSLLEQIEDDMAFRQGVLADPPRMRKLRRTTPLTGILTEEERQQALAQHALGQVHISTLF